MFNNYWWKSYINGTKGIIWPSWNNMSMSKSKRGLGFCSLYDFNIALLGKHCWNFLRNPTSLVSGLFKPRYFLDSHFLRVNKGRELSFFFWNGIWTSNEELSSGFIWLLGDRRDICVVRDLWLRTKRDCMVEHNQVYWDRNELVSSLFLPKLK